VAPSDRFVSENTFYVRYAETDAMGIVHHSVYIVYFEEARSHFSRIVGANYADFERSGYWLTVAEVHARYKVPTRYGQQITARCWIDSSATAISTTITPWSLGGVVSTANSSAFSSERASPLATLTRWVSASGWTSTLSRP